MIMTDANEYLNKNSVENENKYSIDNSNIINNEVSVKENKQKFTANSFLSGRNSEDTLNIVALECLKKSNIEGDLNTILQEYLRIRFELEQKMKQQKKEPQMQTVFDDYIICLEDGKKMKMLKRHLKTKYNMTFQQYKEKWGLPIDYPCTCKNHSKVRANIASKKGDDN